MKNKFYIVLKIFIACAFAASLISCASAPKNSGFLEGYYQEMQPGPKGGAKMRWLKPGVDFGKYNRVIIDKVIYFFADDSEYKAIDPEVLLELSAAFKQEIDDALKDAYPVVSEPGPDVARIQIALTGLKQSLPVISGVTSVIPVGLAVSAIKKGAGGSWTGSGATSAEMFVFDSMSNEVIAVALDEQTAGFTERFSKYGSANEAFKFWAKRIRDFTDNAHGVKK